MSETGEYRLPPHKAGIAKVLDASPEKQTALKEAIDLAFTGVDYYYSEGEVMGARNTEHWLHKSRYVGKEPEPIAWNVNGPFITLEESSRAVKTRKSIFRKWVQEDWQPTKYTLYYRFDWSEQTTAGSWGVRFHYDTNPEGNGELIVGGDQGIFDNLGLDVRDPIGIFTDLVRDLSAKTQ